METTPDPFAKRIRYYGYQQRPVPGERTAYENIGKEETPADGNVPPGARFTRLSRETLVREALTSCGYTDFVETEDSFILNCALPQEEIHRLENITRDILNVDRGSFDHTRTRYMETPFLSTSAATFETEREQPDTEHGAVRAQTERLTKSSTTSNKNAVRTLPIVQGHTSDQLTPDGAEYIPREYDQAGEKKVSPTGRPLDGREYRCRTFLVPNGGDKLFMLATECARVLSYRDSYLMFNKNRSLYKIIASQAEKDDLIYQEILPYTYRWRQVAIVTAKSMFRQFGSRLVQKGRRVRDDYWEAKAREQGFTEEDLTDEKWPGATMAAREAAANEAAATNNTSLVQGQSLLGTHSRSLGWQSNSTGPKDSLVRFQADSPEPAVDGTLPLATSNVFSRSQAEYPTPVSSISYDRNTLLSEFGKPAGRKTNSKWQDEVHADKVPASNMSSLSTDSTLVWMDGPSSVIAPAFDNQSFSSSVMDFDQNARGNKVSISDYPSYTKKGEEEQSLQKFRAPDNTPDNSHSHGSLSTTSSLNRHLHPLPFAPNPAGPRQVSLIKWMGEGEKFAEYDAGQMQSSSTSRPIELDEEEQLLLRLKEEEKLSWEDIATRFQRELGKQYKVPTLVIRFDRLQERLRSWTDLDSMALKQAHKYWEEFRFDIIAAKMLDFGATAKWPTKYCARKWDELYPGSQPFPSNTNLLQDRWGSEHSDPVLPMTSLPRHDTQQGNSTAALLAPIAASVLRASFESGKYKYMIDCVLEDGRHWELKRDYGDFYDFEIAIFKEFPDEAGENGQLRTLSFVSLSFRTLKEQRLYLDKNIKNLLALPSRISKCFLVRKLFAPRESNLELNPRALVKGYDLPDDRQDIWRTSQLDDIDSPESGAREASTLAEIPTTLAQETQSTLQTSQTTAESESGQRHLNVSLQSGNLVQALWDYDGSGHEAALKFKAGDLIRVNEHLLGNWWSGILNGISGPFPSSCCRVVQSSTLTKSTLPKFDSTTELDTARFSSVTAYGKARSQDQIVELSNVVDDEREIRDLEIGQDDLQKTSSKAHARFDTKLEKEDRDYQGKLARFEQDYQSAIQYVKGTEKMLQRLKDELGRYLVQNAKLKAELNTSHRVTHGNEIDDSTRIQDVDDWKQDVFDSKPDVKNWKQDETKARTENIKPGKEPHLKPDMAAALIDVRKGMSMPHCSSQQEPSKIPPSSSAKKHKCPFCSTEFTRHHNLKTHLLTHSHEKPFICDICESRFRRLHDLKRHTKLHTGDRSHVCPTCNRSFAREDALARHKNGLGPCNPQPIDASRNQVASPSVSSYAQEPASIAQRPTPANRLRVASIGPAIAGGEESFEATRQKIKSDISFAEEKDANILGNAQTGSSGSSESESTQSSPTSGLRTDEGVSKGKLTKSTERTASSAVIVKSEYGASDLLFSQPSNAVTPTLAGNSTSCAENSDEECETSMRVPTKRKASGALPTESKRHHSLKFENPALMPWHNTEDPSKPGLGLSPGSNIPSSEPSNADSMLRNSSDLDTSETDFDLLEDMEIGVAQDEDNMLFGPGEERVLNPGSYFNKLERMEAEVALNSSLRYWHPSWIKGRDHTHQSRDIGFSDKFGGSLKDHLLSSSNTGVSHNVSECMQAIARVLANAITMQNARYTTGTFNLLVLYQRRNSVARLISFHLTDIVDIYGAFSLVYKAMESSPDIKMLIEANTHWSCEALTALCKAFLGKVGIVGSSTNHAFILWKRAVLVLDLALLSYAGAHLEAFDEKFLGQKRQDLEIPDGQIPNEGFFGYRSDRVVLRRRRLQCLDEFLGYQHVWVFHLEPRASEPRDESRLLLSTRIETLADVWGPMWKTMRSTDEPHILEYNIGNGVIVPWCQPATTSVAPQLENDEIYCHWISSKKHSVEDVRSHQEGLLNPFFNGTETLLIGAEETPKAQLPSAHQTVHKSFGLHVNPACKLALDDFVHIKSTMMRKGALKEPRTQISRRYKDSHAVQVQGSAMGFVSLADTVTYKRRVGHSMKDTLVERWRHGLRNPVELESYSGVEVSLCTNNARRRRLLEILQTDTVRKYLSSVSFEWVDEICKRRYFQSLGDPKTFRRFWRRHPAYRSCAGDAISICLDAMQETGVNEDNRELSALWVGSFEEEGDSDAEDVLPPDENQEIHEKGQQAGDEAQKARDKSLEARAETPGTKGRQRQICCYDFEAVEEWMVTLFRSEHTWTGFLHDSTECLTMAVMDAACLNVNDTISYGRRCQSQGDHDRGRNGTAKKQQTGFPVLQTALQLNESILKNEGLKCEGQCWNISGIKKNAHFDLGGQGHLTVCAKPNPSPCLRSPLIMEWSPVKSKKWQELKDMSINEDLLGKNPEKHHQEYIRGKWDVEPLPVLILSKSNKISA